MKILYHIPSLDTIGAARTIYNGYKNAFTDLGHEWRVLTADQSLEELLSDYSPDILMTCLSPFYLKYLDLDLIREAKKKSKLKVFVNIPQWNSPLAKTRINETASLSKNKKHLALIASGFYDVFYNVSEQNDPSMDGFERTTGYPFHTVPLAADKVVLRAMFDKAWQADISFIGTNLPQKRAFFNERLFPLEKSYHLKLYGQDWSRGDRALGWVQKGAQYFNIHFLKAIRKPKLALEDEAKIYTSSLVSINIHDEYQRRLGADCNERTFKIPLCGGFEITDDVACIRKYFKDGEEIVIAKDKKDWFEKIEHFIRNPDERTPIIEAGKKKVLDRHTYHNRVNQFLDIYGKKDE